MDQNLSPLAVPSLFALRVPLPTTVPEPQATLHLSFLIPCTSIRNAQSPEVVLSLSSLDHLYPCLLQCLAWLWNNCLVWPWTECPD